MVTAAAPRRGGYITSGGATKAERSARKAAKAAAKESLRAERRMALQAKADLKKDLATRVEKLDFIDPATGAPTFHPDIEEMLDTGYHVRTYPIPLVGRGKKSMKKYARKAADKALKKEIHRLGMQPQSAAAPVIQAIPSGLGSVEGEKLCGFVGLAATAASILANPATIKAIVNVAKPVVKWIAGKIKGWVKKRRGGTGASRGAKIPWDFTGVKGKKLTDVGIWNSAFKVARNRLRAMGAGASAHTPEETRRLIDLHLKAMKKLLLGNVRKYKGRPIGSGAPTTGDILRPMMLRAMTRKHSKLLKSGTALPAEIAKGVQRLVNKLDRDEVMRLPAARLFKKGGSLKSLFKRAKNLIGKVANSKLGKVLVENVLPALGEMASEALTGYAETKGESAKALADIGADLIKSATEKNGVAPKTAKGVSTEDSEEEEKL